MSTTPTDAGPAPSAIDAERVDRGALDAVLSKFKFALRREITQRQAMQAQIARHEEFLSQIALRHRLAGGSDGDTFDSSDVVQATMRVFRRAMDHDKHKFLADVRPLMAEFTRLRDDAVALRAELSQRSSAPAQRLPSANDVVRPSSSLPPVVTAVEVDDKIKAVHAAFGRARAADEGMQEWQRSMIDSRLRQSGQAVDVQLETLRHDLRVVKRRVDDGASSNAAMARQLFGNLERAVADDLQAVAADLHAVRDEILGEIAKRRAACTAANDDLSKQVREVDTNADHRVVGLKADIDAAVASLSSGMRRLEAVLRAEIRTRKAHGETTASAVARLDTRLDTGLDRVQRDRADDVDRLTKRAAQIQDTFEARCQEIAGAQRRLERTITAAAEALARRIADLEETSSTTLTTIDDVRKALRDEIVAESRARQDADEALRAETQKDVENVNQQIAQARADSDSKACALRGELSARLESESRDRQSNVKLLEQVLAKLDGKLVKETQERIASDGELSATLVRHGDDLAREVLVREESSRNANAKADDLCDQIASEVRDRVDALNAMAARVDTVDARLTGESGDRARADQDSDVKITALAAIVDAEIKDRVAAQERLNGTVVETDRKLSDEIRARCTSVDRVADATATLDGKLARESLERSQDVQRIDAKVDSETRDRKADNDTVNATLAALDTKLASEISERSAGVELVAMRFAGVEGRLDGDVRERFDDVDRKVSALDSRVADEARERALDTDRLTMTIAGVEGRLDGDVCDRLAATDRMMSDLAKNIADEVRERSSEADRLAARMAGVESRLDGDVRDRFTEIDRVMRDLDKNIADEVRERSAQIDCVIAQVDAAEKRLDGEIQGRQSGDEQLDRKIASEAQERMASGERVDAALSRFEGRLDGEARDRATECDRKVADLDAKLSDDIRNRNSVIDEQLKEINERVSSEISSRASAVSDIQQAVTSDIARLDKNMVDAMAMVSGEASDRKAADAEIGEKLTALHAALDNEVQNRKENEAKFAELAGSREQVDAKLIADLRSYTDTTVGALAERSGLDLRELSAKVVESQTALDAKLGDVLSKVARLDDGLANEARERTLAGDRLDQAVVALETKLESEVDARSKADDATMKSVLEKQGADVGEKVDTLTKSLDQVKVDIMDAKRDASGVIDKVNTINSNVDDMMRKFGTSVEKAATVQADVEALTTMVSTTKDELSASIETKLRMESAARRSLEGDMKATSSKVDQLAAAVDSLASRIPQGTPTS